MAEGSLYRKYRPSMFSEMAGQKSVLRILENSLSRKKMPHAWLFCGPRGTGKTSSAKIVAKALNCKNRQGVEPCGSCEACISFQKGVYPDFYELDAASNRKIDDFREIRDQVMYPPVQGKDCFKIYIIDEAHMLTKEAANAFLKTLEEPPAWIVFILATTEPEKILPTIISRCIRMDFTLLSREDVKARIYKILHMENWRIEDSALDQIILRGGGGMRDTLTLLEQAQQYCGNHITLEGWLEMMGLAPIDEIDKILESIQKKDQASVVSLWRFLIHRGSQPEELIFQILQRANEYNLYLLKITGDYPPVPAFVLNLKQRYLNSMIKILLTSLDSMKTSLYPEMHGQISLMSCCHQDSFDEPQEKKDGGVVPRELLARIEKLEKQISSAPLEKPVKNVEVRDLSQEKQVYAKKNWGAIYEEIKRRNMILAALVQPAYAREEEGKFTLCFPAMSRFHFGKIQEKPEYMELISSLIQQRVGETIRIEIVLEEEGQTNESVVIKKPSRFVDHKSGESSVSEDLKEKLLRDEGLKDLMEQLGAKIINVE